MAKIRLTRKLVPLLEELDAAVGMFAELSVLLADPNCQGAVTIGAQRESQRRILAGIAYRINKASKGET